MPVIPRKLAREYKAAGSQRALARRLGLNPRYINDLLTKGKEPANPEIRAKMFLPRRPRQARRPRPPAPEWVKPIRRGIRKLAKQTRKAINEHHR